MEEAHGGVCGVYQGKLKLDDCVKRMGYYWSTMVCDCIDLLGGTSHANYMLTSFINPQSHCTQLWHPGLSRHGHWMS